MYRLQTQGQSMLLVQGHSSPCGWKGIKSGGIFVKCELILLTVIIDHRMPGVDATGPKHHPDFSGIDFIKVHRPNHELRNRTLRKNARWRRAAYGRDKTHDINYNPKRNNLDI